MTGGSKWSFIGPLSLLLFYCLLTAYPGIVYRRIGSQKTISDTTGQAAFNQGLGWLGAAVIVLIIMWLFNRWYDSDDYM
jgi:hypothetical protein